VKFGQENVHNIVHTRELRQLESEFLRIAVVSDTHGLPHPNLAQHLRELAPGHIVHAGDVGDFGVIRHLEKLARVTAVRGNVDGHDWADRVTLDVRDEQRSYLRILITHCALNGPTLRSDVARIARAEDASLVVCGHSHVPFAGRDGELTIFNPGSVGPRRFRLPITFGVIEVSAKGISVRHVDCETGLPWAP